MNNRPDIDPARLAEWEKQFDEWMIPGMSDQMNQMRKKPPHRAAFLESWFAGQWLSEELRAAGASEEENGNIGFAHGQRCVFEPCWTSAQAMLADYKNGIVPVPGEMLGLDLLTRHMEKLQRGEP